jgi:hypothetical protein
MRVEVRGEVRSKVLEHVLVGEAEKSVTYCDWAHA